MFSWIDGFSCCVCSFVLARKIKRFLAYSSVGHVGYLLIGFATGTVEGVQGMLLYSLIYIITTLGAWTFLLSLERHSSGRAVYMTDLASLSNTNPLLAISFACIMLSMAGVPPLAGFSAKMYVFFAAMEGSMFMLAILGILSSVIGAFYYIRFIKIMYFENMKSWTLYAPIGREQSFSVGNIYIVSIGILFIPYSVLNIIS